MTGGAWLPVLRFAVGGRPVGASRPRVAAGRAYMPAGHVSAEGHIAGAAHAAWVEAWWVMAAPFSRDARPASLDEPVRVDVVLVAARPQRLCRKRDPDGRIPRARGKPDADNAAKLVMDALVKALVLRDDTLVCVLHVERWYAARDEGAATEVVVSTWRDGAEGGG
jgi:Holliday junction resolvase RusA-like endonuclease